MNGPQDLGGRMGFGPVVREADEPVYHARWEERAMGMTICAGGLGYWNIDESRHMRETMPPARYLSASYYEIWLDALERLLLQHGAISEEELRTGQADGPGERADRCLDPEGVRALLSGCKPYARAATSPARFAQGAPVRTRRDVSAGHCRLPDYARDKPGVIEAVHSPHVLPDDNAHGRGENPEWLYTVRFDGADLFGAGAAGTSVSIDAWESYLVPR